MLVVPNHWGDCPIVPGSPFATRLRDWSDRGIEIFLHGWSHRDAIAHAGVADRVRARHLTAGEGEFLGLSRGQASTLIGDGRALLEGIIGRPIAGFVAPAWLYGPGARQALVDCGIELAEDHMRVWSPVRGVVLVAEPGHHLGEPQPVAEDVIAGPGRRDAPRAAARGDADRRAPARCPLAGAAQKHRRNDRGIGEDPPARRLRRAAGRRRPAIGKAPVAVKAAP